jgi:hypothetical protein
LKTITIGSEVAELLITLKGADISEVFELGSMNLAGHGGFETMVFDEEEIIENNSQIKISREVGDIVIGLSGWDMEEIYRKRTLKLRGKGGFQTMKLSEDGFDWILNRLRD